MSGPKAPLPGSAPRAAGEDSAHGAEIPTALAPPPGRPGDERFLSHLASAGELVAARRYREAEVEVLRALSGMPADLRALNLLALVRFKLGRLEEARATYHEIAAAAPNDAAARRNLGLLAIKLERIDEAIPELEMAARLSPADQRAWSYLGYAYAKKGEPVAAAAAFRKAGQDALAAELENATVARRSPTAPALALQSMSMGGAPPPAVESSSVVSAPGMVPAPVAPARAEAAPAVAERASVAVAEPVLAPAAAPAAAPAFARPAVAVVPDLSAPVDAVLPVPHLGRGVTPSIEADVVPLVSFVVSRLGLGAPVVPARTLALRLPVGDEAHLRADVALAGVRVTFEPAFRRVQGRRTPVPLGAAGMPFFRAVGPGELWLAGSAGRWLAVSLEEDVLYVREDRVLAFDGSLSWEAGAIPGDGLRMLQFRGRGNVVFQLDAAPAAVKVTEEQPATIASARLFGWVGRLVAHRPRAAGPGPCPITCEGEGVVLFDLGDPQGIPHAI